MQKRLERERKGLERSIENNKEAEEDKWQARRDYLERSLEDFTRYVAKDAKDLRQHIKLWKKEHKGLSVDTGDMFKMTAKEVKEALISRMKETRRAVVNDLQWAKGGKKMARDMIEGAFGMNLKQFRRWMITGKYPSGAKKDDDVNNPPSAGQGAPGSSGPGPDNHTGGWAGTYNNRKGVARTNPTHPSEINIRARKGQYILNERASAQYAPVLEAMNNGGKIPGRVNPIKGTDSPGPREKATGGATGPMGAALGFVGILAAAMKNAGSGAIKQGMEVGAAEARAKQAALASMSGGAFLAGKAGVFGDRAFSKSQLGHAATIASVGSKMGMSKRDIKIGIMTAITESGLSLPNQANSDRDSAGLFQQRPSQGWGTVAQVMDPEYASRKFFQALKAVGNRDDLSPWMAAQTVQRSAYSNGSNYRQYWDEAVAIFRDGLRRDASAGFIAGPGGAHRPVKGGSITQGLHGSPPAIDIGVPVGRKIYAVGDGKIKESYDLKGFEPRRASTHGGNGYYSYGRVITLGLNGGGSVLYAHLSERSAKKGQRVKGGSVIGRSGNTGNSGGPHLHFGATNGQPAAFLKVGGIIKQDGTPAILHRNETVLTEPLSKALHDGIGGISDAGQVLEEIRRSGMSGGGLDWSKVGQLLSGGGRAGGGGGGNNNNGGSNGGGGGGGVGGSNSGGNNSHTGKKGNVRVGTYNVAWKTGLGTTAPDIKALMEKSDILGLQEVYKRREKLVSKAFRDKGWGHSPIKHDNVIGWNKRMFEMIKSGNQGLNPNMTGGGRNAVNRMAAYALLRNKKTKKKMWAVSTHLQPFANSSPRLRAIQDLQFRNLQKMYNKMNKTAPVVMVGDFNRDLLAHPGSIPKGMRTSVKNKKLGGTHGKNWLDFVLMGKSITSAGNSIIRKGMDSDHHAFIAGLNIPGMRDGGFTLNDGIAKLHKKETVLTAPLSEKLNIGIDKLAEGSGDNYTLNMYDVPNTINETIVANKVVKTLDRQKSRKAGSRTVSSRTVTRRPR
jgi:murein DD-endopeptidase MepM/ murein hydrolase activator NlpD/endonuclease/exonuclease/phosphatase family metal-dependent hydrolase